MKLHQPYERTKQGTLRHFGGVIPILTIIVIASLLASYRFMDGFAREIEVVLSGNDKEYYFNLTYGLDERRDSWVKFQKKINNERNEYKLPDVIGIGAKKCGTSALLEFLNSNPRVKVPRGKFVETFYFSTEQYYKGLDSYRLLMQKASTHDVVIEKTPDYFTSGKIAAPRIKQTLPNVRLLLMLCDPVNRAFSEYNHRAKTDKAFFKRWPSFHGYIVVNLAKVKRLSNTISLTEMANKDPDLQPITNGIYSEYLPVWTQYFNSSQLMMIDGERFVNNPIETLRKVESFLKLPQFLKPGDFVTNPETGLECIRPWWNESYSFEDEILKRNHWEQNLICSSMNTHGTRGKNKVARLLFPMTSRDLDSFFKKYNAKLNKMSHLKFDWLLS